MKKTHWLPLSIVALVCSSCFWKVEVHGEYEQVKCSDMPFTLKDLNLSTGLDTLNTTGDVSILVVPVDIKGASKAWNETMLDKVNKSFFGDASDTSWQSVSSYYNASSYGKLKISGEVAPIFHCSKTKSELIKNKSGNEIMPDTPVVTEWLKDSSYDSLREQYDIDENGNVDGVVFIYNEKIDYDNGFWAWVYWYDISTSKAHTVNTYMWAGYDFIDSKDYGNYGSNGIDSHIYIHETGHMLGLDDYYPYKDGERDPSGCIDMHSYNIGDENIYSKIALGWIDPYYIKTEDSVTLQLKSSALYGEGIIINDNWNKNAFDEYLAIEFYTPEGMNEIDSKKAYRNGYKMYDIPGVRMYHIDSRIVKATPKDKYFVYSYAEPTKEDLQNEYYLIGPKNSDVSEHLPTSEKNDIKQVTLIDSLNRKDYNEGCADNKTLFRKGSKFVANSNFFVNNGKFDNGNSVGYKVKINNINSEYVTLTIKKTNTLFNL